MNFHLLWRAMMTCAILFFVYQIGKGTQKHWNEKQWGDVAIDIVLLALCVGSELLVLSDVVFRS